MARPARVIIATEVRFLLGQVGRRAIMGQINDKYSVRIGLVLNELGAIKENRMVNQVRNRRFSR